MVVLLLAAVMGYLLGSLSFAVIVSRWFKLPDPHSYGSGNPGATNVLRGGSKKAAVVTLIGDAGKGVVAVLLAIAIERQWGGGSAVIALAGLSAFLGHLYPVFFGFRGGKGVATAAGILIAIDWRVGLAVLAIWIGMALVFRISSLSALCAALAAPVVAYALGLDQFELIAIVLMSLLLIARHRSNLQRLLSGEEGRIDAKGQGGSTPGA